MAYQVIINLCKLLSIYCSISPERSPNLNVHLCQYGNLDVDLRCRLTLDAGALRELCRHPLLVFYLRLPRCLLFSATRQQRVRKMSNFVPLSTSKIQVSTVKLNFEGSVSGKA